MHLLIVIGAGASFDCWPGFIDRPHNYSQIRLPLANSLFASLPVQNSFLSKYNLMGLASTLRSRVREKMGKFDIEFELANISSKANKISDSNVIQSLFKARFYLHGLISDLSNKTLTGTHSHTTYVDLLAKIKEWIDDSPKSRFVDIVDFNYDNLIERAMENVYGFDWYSKNQNGELTAYYNGVNLNIYKPHGSINWGREIIKGENLFEYTNVSETFHEFNKLEISNGFKFVDPDVFYIDEPKSYIPAIAVPFKGKTNFDECPDEMQFKMVEAINKAEKVITLGWKGGDTNFTNILKTNNKIGEIHIVSPNAATSMGEFFSEKIFKFHPLGFKDFISDSSEMDELLSKIDGD